MASAKKRGTTNQPSRQQGSSQPSRQTAQPSPEAARLAKQRENIARFSEQSSVVAFQNERAALAKQSTEGKGGLTGALWGALKAIDKPRSAIVSTVKETVDLFQGESFSFNDWKQQFDENIGFSTVLDDLGVENKYVRGVAGFVGDVALDPLTYLTAGVGSGINRGTNARAAFRMAQNVDDAALATRLQSVGSRLINRGGTALGADDVALLGAARLAETSTDVARSTQFARLARKAATEGLSVSERNLISKAAPQALKPGARLTVPGTGRLARGVTRKLGAEVTQRTVQVLPQAATKYTPRGLFQAARSGAAGTESVSTIRRLLGGDFASIKAKIADVSNPAQQGQALFTLDSARAGRGAAQRFRDDIERSTTILYDALDEADLPHVLPALQGSADAQAALGARWGTVETWRDQWLSSANEMAGSDFIRELSTWSPSKPSEDFTAWIDSLSPERTTQVVSRGVDPKAPVASIAAGREFLGTPLLDAAEHPMGLTPRQQADGLMSDYLEELGEAPIQSMFSDDFVASVEASKNTVARQIERERTMVELYRHGVAVDLVDWDDISALDSARRARGRNMLSRVRQLAIRDQSKAMRDQLDLRVKAATADTLDDAVRSADDDLASAIDGLDTAAEGVKAAPIVARAHARVMDEMLDVVEGATVDNFRDQITEINAAMARINTDHDNTFGEISRLKVQRERLQDEIQALHVGAARDVDRAGDVGRQLAELDVKVRQLDEQIVNNDILIERSGNIAEALPDVQRRLASEEERYAKLSAVLAKGVPNGESATAVQAGLADLADVGLSSFSQARAEFDKLDALLPKVRQLRDQLVEQSDLIAGARAGDDLIGSTASFREQAATARLKIDELRETLGEESREFQILAAAQAPPAVDNGRLVTRRGDTEWGLGAAGARTGSDNVAGTERFWGPVFTERSVDPLVAARAGADAARDPRTGKIIPAMGQRYAVGSKYPMHYPKGRAGMYTDWMDAYLSDASRLPSKEWGEGWGEVAQLVRGGDTSLDQAIRKVMGDVDPQRVISDLMDGTVLTSNAKRNIARAGRTRTIARGYDSVTYLDEEGAWAVMPVSRDQAEGFTTDMTEDTLETYIRIEREMTDRLYDTARARQAQYDELGADIEALNGRLSDIDAENQTRKLAERKAEIQQDLIRAKHPKDRSEILGRELDRITHAEDMKLAAQARRDAAAAASDDAVREREAALGVVADLEAQADVAQARLIRAKGRRIDTEDALRKIESMPKAEIDEMSKLMEEAIGAGFRRVGDTNTQIPNWVSEGLQGHAKIVNDPVGMLRYFDKFTRLWKAQATASVGFHSRNYMGGLINNFSADVDFGRYGQVRNISRKFDELLNGGMSPEDAAAQFARGSDVEQQWAQIVRSGVLGGGQFDELAYIGQGARSLNPLNERFALYKAGRRAGVSVEGNLRGALALDVMQKGGTMDDAMDAVYKMHFDYEDLSSFESNVLRRVIPFYTWSRKNLPLQIELLFENPKAFSRYMTLQRNLEQGTQEESLVPSYFERLNTIRLPWKMGGSQLYMNPTTPFSDLTRTANPSELLASVNPLLRVPVELKTDQSFFYGSPFGERYEETSPAWDFLGIPQAASLLGYGERNEEGKWTMPRSAVHVVNDLMPLLGAARRNTPGGPRDNDRVTSSLISWAFGVGLRANTPKDQSNELYRQADDILGEIEKLESLGKDTDAQALRDQRFDILDMARELREEE